MAEQLRPQLLQQYSDAKLNFVRLHKWDNLRTHVTVKGKKRKLPKPVELGKAPKDDAWTTSKVSYQQALEHMKAGYNVGVQMSSEGYAVIDYDPRHDPEAGTKNSALDKLLVDAKLDKVKHAKVITGSLRGDVRGCHIYVKIDKEWRGRTKLAEGTKYPGVEFKHSPGQQVVAAGSIHPSGGRYQFDEESVPLEEAAEVTPELLEIFEHKAPPNQLKGEGEQSWGAFQPDEIAKALKHVDVQLYNGEHDKWLEFMMAISWASGGLACEEFLEWSASDPSYTDDTEINRERWDTTIVDPRLEDTAQMIKSGTMFKHFQEAGVPPEHMPRMRVELMYDDVDSDDWEIDFEHESKERIVLRQMNADHALVAEGQRPLFLKPSINKVTGCDGDFELVGRPTLAALYANKKLVLKHDLGDGKFKTEVVNYFDFWFTHPERRTYYGTLYKPSIDSQEVKIGEHTYFNEFRGWPHSHTERGRGQWKLFRELIFKVLASGNQEWFDYIIKWMAYSVQNPEGPQGVMLVFQGIKGIGKSLVLERWKRLFGTGGLTTQRMDTLLGNFNSQLRRTSALLLEEGLWAGDKKNENILKQLITGESVQTEAKFMDAQETANNLAIGMATNNQWAVPATPDERRFAVFEAQEVWPANHPHFGKIVREMDYEGGSQAFFYDLVNMELGDWHPRQGIPMTPALQSQIVTTAGPITQWWGQVLSRGHIPYIMGAARYNRGYAPGVWEKGNVAVLLSELKHSFRRFLGDSPSRKWVTNFDQTFSYELKQLLPGRNYEVRMRKIPLQTPEFEDIVPTLSQGRDRFLELPDLETCRSYAVRHGVDVVLEMSSQLDNSEDDFDDEDYDDLI